MTTAKLISYTYPFMVFEKKQCSHKPVSHKTNSSLKKLSVAYMCLRDSVYLGRSTYAQWQGNSALPSGNNRFCSFAREQCIGLVSLVFSAIGSGERNRGMGSGGGKERASGGSGAHSCGIGIDAHAIGCGIDVGQSVGLRRAVHISPPCSSQGSGSGRVSWSNNRFGFWIGRKWQIGDFRWPPGGILGVKNWLQGVVSIPAFSISAHKGKPTEFGHILYPVMGQLKVEFF